MLRMCVLDFEGSWDEYLPLVKFTYNDSRHSTIGMAPSKALYGRKCRPPLRWTEVDDRQLKGPELTRMTSEAVSLIQARLKAAFNRQQSYADLKRRDIQFHVSDLVFLKVSPMKGLMRFEKKEKLAPRYIGPFEILDRVGGVSYRLASPDELSTLSVSCLHAFKVCI